MEGEGKYEWASGNSYEGTWKAGKRDGKGKFNKRGILYLQEYKNGRLLKQKRYISSNLSKFVQYTNSVGGADKVFRIICYTGKILLWWLKKTGRESLAKRFANFISPISETRVILRFFGLFGTIQGFFYKDPDPFLNLMYLIENISMLVYYPSEHIAWASSREIIFGFDSNKLYKWSCRAWLLYILLDILTDCNNFLKLKIKSQIMYKDVVDDQPDKIPEEHLADIKSLRQTNLLKFVQNFSDMVLAINWSVDNGPVSDLGLGVAGSIASFVGFYLRWKNT